MKFFDLHCDTIGECYNKKVPLRKNNFHLDLDRAKELGEYTQVFAIWISDELRGKDAVKYFDDVADCFYKEIKENSDLISLCGENKKTPIKAILSDEGGSACGGTIEGLYHLYERGVRLITLTWNDKNEIGSGAFSEGGLTDFGRAFIKDFSCIDYYTVSAHKLHALKGTGAVLYKKGTPLKPFVVGGGQEYGLRSGTENTFGVYAFKVASEYFLKNKNSIAEHLAHLKDIFLSEIKKDSSIEIVSPENGASHIVSLSIKNVRGEVLLHALEDDKIYISTGSACSSKKGVSRTAKSLGLSKQQAEGIVRISFSPFNTEAEVLTAAEKIKEKIQMLSLFVRK